MMTMVPTSARSALVRNLRNIAVAGWVAGCGGDHKAIDAMPDMASLNLDCSTYCDKIQANCTGANQQYLDAEHCAATCMSFTVGTSTVTDTSGDTLGCRINYAVAAATTPATHCAHAGPAGDQITASPAFCSGGDSCTIFCTLEIKACGSSDVPLPGDPKDATNNPLWQYKNMADCMRSCDGDGSVFPGYDKTHAYTTTSMGNSLACRLLQATSAAISVTPNAKMYCANTAEFARGPCVGTASP